MASVLISSQPAYFCVLVFRVIIVPDVYNPVQKNRGQSLNLRSPVNAFGNTYAVRQEVLTMCGAGLKEWERTF
jgi:hypothetical protein